MCLAAHFQLCLLPPPHPIQPAPALCAAAVTARVQDGRVNVLYSTPSAYVAAKKAYTDVSFSLKGGCGAVRGWSRSSACS